MNSNLAQKKLQIEKQKSLLLDSSTPISVSNILASTDFQDVIHHCRDFRDRIFNPLVTLFIFIKQVLSPDKSCKKALADFIAEQAHHGHDDLVSSNTGPYCKARQRLPQETVRELVQKTGQSTAKKASAGWKVYGREVKALDGTTVKMADSKANQTAFPQESNQKEGLGFPIARLLVVVSLTVGTVIDYAVGAYKGKGSGEASLLRRVLNNSIQKDDIVLGDRYFPSFFLMADLQTTGADGVFRGHRHRRYDFRKGKSSGKKDHIVDWKKPCKPEWMEQERYDTYSDTIEIREFKVAGHVYVTTFLNEKKYNKRELAKIYKLRWYIEINLNSIKTIMKMDMLSCKTPDMILKEIGIHLLAYNFIRIIMAEACQQYDAVPREVSFKGALQLLNSFMPHFIHSNQKDNQKMFLRMLSLIVKNKIGTRPGRVEPRAIKQRKKAFNLLVNPRNIEQIRIKKQIEKRALRYAEA